MTAKKGRIKVHHYAHVANSCRPPIPYFDFWATNIDETTWPLDEFAQRHAQQLLAEQQRLDEQHTNAQTNWQRIKSLMAELLDILGDVSQPYKTGTRPANRQANFEILTDVQAFLESLSADRGPVPALYKVRHSQFSGYWNLDLKPRRWGSFSDWGCAVSPGQLWQEELSGISYIIPSKLRKHYNALIEYHRAYNELTDLTTEHDAFERTLSRFISFNFYFLRVGLPSGTLYKSGVTSRPLPERLVEIERDLRSLGPVTIEPLAHVKQVGYLEAYFKRKYAPYQHALSTASGPLTEYFDLPPDEVTDIVIALRSLMRDDVAPAEPTTRSERVRAGMRRAQASGKMLGRPKAPERTDAFLQKTKSQTITQLLQAGHSLREIERQTGFSINTIRKVNETFKAPNVPFVRSNPSQAGQTGGQCGSGRSKRW
ncbi:hypothetical protein J2I47_07650 [Fibrella sp. HMF5335]|uniref:Uncharacterized protein n=1 Tax=Fibrella rubiginis TaxID=2817060 RepID=A0A939GFR4_9BACT|nr:hypothetical protein [Fibrella rubiginis]MBO0936419.1 hypothetical protein [Fibrella rubiginis]